MNLVLFQRYQAQLKKMAIPSCPGTVNLAVTTILQSPLEEQLSGALHSAMVLSCACHGADLCPPFLQQKNFVAYFLSEDTLNFRYNSLE